MRHHAHVRAPSCSPRWRPAPPWSPMNWKNASARPSPPGMTSPWWLQRGGPSGQRDIEPIVDARCLVCNGHQDAPDQLRWSTATLNAACSSWSAASRRPGGRCNRSPAGGHLSIQRGVATPPSGRRARDCAGQDAPHGQGVRVGQPAHQPRQGVAGDGHNLHAALTIFRPFDRATVELGLIGPPPKTAWVLGYPLWGRLEHR